MVHKKMSEDQKSKLEIQRRQLWIDAWLAGFSVEQDVTNASQLGPLPTEAGSVADRALNEFDETFGDSESD